MDFLQLTSDEYEDRILQVYWAWCRKHGRKDPNLTQWLLANAEVNRWFWKEYGRMQRHFIDMVPNAKKGGIELNGLYAGCTIGIYDLYPRPLVTEAKLNPEFLNRFMLTPIFDLYGN